MVHTWIYTRYSTVITYHVGVSRYRLISVLYLLSAVTISLHGSCLLHGDVVSPFDTTKLVY
jgi:hypothetical protein